MKVVDIKKAIEEAQSLTSTSYTGRQVSFPSLGNLKAASEKDRIISLHLEELLEVVFKAHQAIQDMDPLFNSTQELKIALEALEQKG